MIWYQDSFNMSRYVGGYLGVVSRGVVLAVTVGKPGLNPGPATGISPPVPKKRACWLTLSSFDVDPNWRS